MVVPPFGCPNNDGGGDVALDVKTFVVFDTEAEGVAGEVALSRANGLPVIFAGIDAGEPAPPPTARLCPKLLSGTKGLTRPLFSGRD